MAAQQTTTPTSVLVVDPNPLIHVAISSILEKTVDCRVVGQVLNSADALDLAQRLNPDVVVLEIRLGQGSLSGVQVAEALRELSPASRVLIFSNCTQDPYIRRLTAAGVRGYITKASNADTVLNAIRTVARGEAVYSAEINERITGRGRGWSDPSGRSRPWLTDREGEALQYAAQGLCNEHIGLRMGLAKSSVQVYLAAASDKLHTSNRIDMIVRAARLGLAVIDEDCPTSSPAPLPAPEPHRSPLHLTTRAAHHAHLN